MKIQATDFRPRARRHAIITKEADGELLIYDEMRDRAHCLNETAAAVWRLCDGRTSVNEIAAHVTGDKLDQGRLARNECEAQANDAEQIVWLTLEQLKGSHLLEDDNSVSLSLFPFSGLSRREAVRRIGLGAAIALPLVASMTAPTAVEAAVSCGAKCKTCSTPTDCCNVCSSNVPGCPPGNRCT